MSTLGYLSRNLFEPLYNSVRGFGEINSTVAHWRDLFAMPFAETVELRERQLVSALQRAYSDVPYYHELFDRLGVSKRLEMPGILHEIPMLNKDIIRSNAEAILNRTIPKEKLLKTATGGSTSDPLVFYRDRHCYCERWGLQAAANIEQGWLPGEWYGIVWGAVQDLPKGDTLRNRFMNQLVYRRILLNSSALDDRLLTDFLNQVRRYRPEIIYGYPVMLGVVAEAMLGSKLEVPAPKKVIVTAEKLTERARELIGKAFKAPVIDRYASREFGVIADQVAGTEMLRVVPGSVHIEIDPISADNPDYGELVITDLLNRGMPMIRYRTGDVGRLVKTRVNGAEGLYLCDISGRTTDLIVRNDGKLVSGTGAAPFFNEYIGIDQVQIHQLAIDRFEVKVKPNSDYSPETERLIRESLEGYCGSKIELTFNKVDHIAKDASGKFRIFISDVAPTLFGVTSDSSSSPH